MTIFYWITRCISVAAAISAFAFADVKSAEAKSIVPPPPSSQLGSANLSTPDLLSAVACSVAYSANNDRNRADEATFALVVGPKQPAPPTGIPEYGIGLPSALPMFQVPLRRLSHSRTALQ